MAGAVRTVVVGHREGDALLPPVLLRIVVVVERRAVTGVEVLVVVVDAELEPTRAVDGSSRDAALERLVELRGYRVVAVGPKAHAVAVRRVLNRVRVREAREVAAGQGDVGRPCLLANPSALLACRGVGLVVLADLGAAVLDVDLTDQVERGRIGRGACRVVNLPVVRRGVRVDVDIVRLGLLGFRKALELLEAEDDLPVPHIAELLVHLAVGAPHDALLRQRGGLRQDVGHHPIGDILVVGVDLDRPDDVVGLRVVRAPLLRVLLEAHALVGAAVLAAGGGGGLVGHGRVRAVRRPLGVHRIGEHVLLARRELGKPAQREGRAVVSVVVPGGGAAERLLTTIREDLLQRKGPLLVGRGGVARVPLVQTVRDVHRAGRALLGGDGHRVVNLAVVVALRRRLLDLDVVVGVLSAARLLLLLDGDGSAIATEFDLVGLAAAVVADNALEDDGAGQRASVCNGGFVEVQGDAAVSGDLVGAEHLSLQGNRSLQLPYGLQAIWNLVGNRVVALAEFAPWNLVVDGGLNVVAISELGRRVTVLAVVILLLHGHRLDVLRKVNAVTVGVSGCGGRRCGHQGHGPHACGSLVLALLDARRGSAGVLALGSLCLLRGLRDLEAHRVVEVDRRLTGLVAGQVAEAEVEVHVAGEVARRDHDLGPARLCAVPALRHVLVARGGRSGRGSDRGAGRRGRLRAAGVGERDVVVEGQRKHVAVQAVGADRARVDAGGVAHRGAREDVALEGPGGRVRVHRGREAVLQRGPVGQGASGELERHAQAQLGGGVQRAAAVRLGPGRVACARRAPEHGRVIVDGAPQRVAASERVGRVHEQCRAHHGHHRTSNRRQAKEPAPPAVVPKHPASFFEESVHGSPESSSLSTCVASTCAALSPREGRTPTRAECNPPSPSVQRPPARTPGGRSCRRTPRSSSPGPRRRRTCAHRSSART